MRMVVKIAQQLKKKNVGWVRNPADVGVFHKSELSSYMPARSHLSARVPKSWTQISFTSARPISS